MTITHDIARQTLEFRILGPLEVWAGGGLVPLGSAKERALLIRLLVSGGRVVPVDVLIDDLWGSNPPDQAAANLRVYVSRLRKRLRDAGGDEDLLVTRPPGYVFAVPPEAIDVAQCEEAAAEVRRLMGAGAVEQAAATARRALALFRGPALGDATAYLFAQSEATRLEELRCALVEERIEAELALGAHGDLVGELDWLVKRHPYRERLWGQLMLALYRSGRQVEALRAFERVRRILAEDLGINPSAELAALENHILCQSAALAPCAPAPTPPLALPAPAPPALASGPFVGRTSELAALLAGWERACAGHLHLTVVTGEAGIGKTSLAHQMAARCADDGGIVLLGHCDESMVVPYQPFVAAASQYLSARDPHDVSTWRLPGAVELAGLLGSERPDVDLVPRPDADTVTRRFWLFDAFVSVLREASHEAPLLVVIDDAHWADIPTLRLLRHVVEQGSDLAVHLVVTYRSDELPPDGPLAVTLGELARICRFDRVGLTGLDAGDVASLLTERFGAAPSDDAVRRLLDETEGNPFFVEELLQAVAAPGPAPDALVVAAHGVPDRIKDMIRRRIDRLPSETRKLVEVASVLGRSFAIDVAVEIADLDEREFPDALDGAIEAGLVHGEDGGLGSYGFVHVLIRHCLYEGLGPARRTWLHRRAGQLLLGRYGLEPGPILQDIARHLTNGVMSRDDASLAVDALVASGRRALDGLAYEEAAAQYRRALALVNAGSWVDDSRRVSLLILLAEAQARSGELEGSAAVLAEATAIARRIGAAELLGRAALSFTAEPWGFGWTVHSDERTRLLEDALDLVGESDPALRGALLARLSLELYQTDQRDRCVDVAHEALATVAPLGDIALLFGAREADLVSRLGVDLEPKLQLEQATEIVELAARVGSERAVLSARQLREAALLQVGDMASFAREVAAAKTSAAELSLPTFGYWAMVHETMLEITGGDFAAAERRATDTFLAGQRIDAATAMAILGPQLITIGWARDRLEPLVEPAEALVRQFPQFPVYRAALAFAYAETGHDGARRELDWFMRRGLDDLSRDDHWLIMLFLLSVVSDAVADRAAASSLHRVLRPYSSRLAAPANGVVCLGSVAAAVGVVARAAGDLAEADRAFREATVMNQHIGARPFLAFTLAEHARCLYEIGDVDTAGRLEQEAWEMAARMEMGGLLRRISARATGLQLDSNGPR